MKIYQTVIIGRKEVAERTLEVTFKRPADFDFKAGQYVQVELPSMPRTDHKGNSRVFSVASSPDDTKKLSVAFRRSDSGFKSSIATVPLGSEVNIQGPYGFITLEREPGRPLVCVAGGIGITPCLSMIRFARDSKLAAPIALVYANRNKETAAYLSELEKVSRSNKWLTLKMVFGPIDQPTIHTLASNHPGSRWLITGPPAMVDAVRGLLFLDGIDEHQVFFEEFQGY